MKLLISLSKFLNSVPLFWLCVCCVDWITSKSAGLRFVVMSTRFDACNLIGFQWRSFVFYTTLYHPPFSIVRAIKSAENKKHMELWNCKDSTSWAESLITSRIYKQWSLCERESKPRRSRNHGTQDWMCPSWIIFMIIIRLQPINRSETKSISIHGIAPHPHQILPKPSQDFISLIGPRFVSLSFTSQVAGCSMIGGWWIWEQDQVRLF